ncbi:Lrp/AsnC family transcriptional regulator [Virgibacillus ndiopensis]|uniref:Lrp/AsnC family transcriptional regulator n=1 Tax=Virgibacillus ndiopensis TaxID=2004408 RepID=UPI000C088638|nr:Lrp/AsnC family transcriptional regulator [Virgibacillus ndiopensis]
MNYKIDELDRGIIKLLSNDGRMSFTELATRLSVTEKTVRLRYKSLLDKEILEVVGVVNPIALGLKAGAIIQLKVKAKGISTVVEELKKVKLIRYITLTSGDYPILVQITVEDQDQITKVLRDINQIDEVTDVNTIVQLEVYRNTFDYML